MELVTYSKCKTTEEAGELIELLKQHAINYLLEPIPEPPLVTYTGKDDKADILAIKIKPADFEKVDQLLNQAATENIEKLDSDYYLFEFTDAELFEILERFDEWSREDVLLAQKLLNARGTPVTDEKVQELKNKRIARLRQPEKGRTGWLVFGFICTLLGGLLGIFIGYHHYQFKKIIPTGEKVYAYDTKTRKTGKQVFYAGILGLVAWFVLWMLKL
ncbi:MAG TPA: hypothetical protein DCQ26_00350 [Marinilabiliales bacterium]|nr:MAG: hypothetical protein A2W95_03840 [Bacteroidetes bacterium GWA2_40_14]OFX75223.1 MAG: hypothetical protein A2W96_16630 [Bacteroidetes bacterium GWD2_40_43]OFX89820.1 MAG: hypothetical protein A2W97_12290 [Bacteroidetes bacterium GWE2_40_63]OFY21987.1 MAG: hypothetical protein A2W88_00555 [Bacteroidetes bacterium GWF2_40_13]HAM97038.1 hypothetical protein [Marinilabiliales bacterium]